ncbi:MAG: DUF6768 family protein [Planctomycetota bacterium]|jgi:hypothetical protein
MDTEPKICDDSKENSLCTMFKDFYNMKMLSVIIFTWAWGIIIIALAIFSAVKFFKVDEIKDSIMYAVIFLTCMIWVSLMKIWAWQMIHRNNIKRQIKRLETTVAELTQIVKSK